MMSATSGSRTMSGIPTRPRIVWDQIVPGIGLYKVQLTADFTILPEHNTVEIDASGGAVAVTLPAVAACYRDIVISKRDASGNAVTIDADGSETINGSTTFVLSSQYDAARLTPGDAEWLLT
jgi:hypothetical protein